MADRLRKKLGPHLELDAPTAFELDWIFEALQTPAIHIAMACPAPPARALFDAGCLDVLEGDAVERERVRYWIVRHRLDGNPYAFFIEFDWHGLGDDTREYDLAIPNTSGSLGLYLEAHVLGIMFVFDNGLAKRMRWTVAVSGSRPLRWFQRIGVRDIGHIDVRHPITREPLRKQVYEVSRRDFDQVLARAGMRKENDYDVWPVPLWQLLA